MAGASLTPQDYDLALRDLRQKLAAYLERGEGDRRALRRQAEDTLALADQFPELYARYPDVEGMVAELLARQQQEKFMATDAPRQAPGCMLGWLFRRGRE